MNEFLGLIKKAAREQEMAGKPMAVMFGTVTKDSPLEIQIDQKMTLKESFLILTKNVVDYSTDMTVDHVTEICWHHYEEGNHDKEVPGVHRHIHEYKGRKKFTIHHKLKVGDMVIILRVQGGKKFVVLDIIGGGEV